MPPAPTSAARQRGYPGKLSARHFAEIRELSRIAHDIEGVTFTLHGVKISGDSRDAGQHPDRSGHEQEYGSANSSETDDKTQAKKTSKKKERDTLRRKDHVPKRCVARWLSFAGRVRWAARRQHLDAAFVKWMRSRRGPRRVVRRKLRDLLWRAWTHRQFELPGNSNSKPSCLGRCSYRDMYIFRKAAALCPQLQRLGLIADSSYHSDGWITTDDEEPEMQAAVAASLADSNARSPGSRNVHTRSLHEAGIPATPGSARARKKRSGRM